MTHLLLANAGAITPNGLLQLDGAGWEHYTVPSLPWTIQGVAAGLIAFDANEVGGTFEVSMVVRQEGEEIGSRASLLLAPKGTVLPFVIPFTGILRNASDLDVRVDDSDGPLANTSCLIRVQSDQQ